MISRRAIALCRPGAPGREVQHLLHLYGLELVYTVITDCVSTKLTTMIAAQHLFEHDAKALVLPHMTRAQVEADAKWSALTIAADIVTGDGLVQYTPPS